MESPDLISILWRVLAVLVLVLLNGFFVAAEFALVKVRDTQLTPLISAGNRRAGVARFILSRLDAFLSAAQLGITLASLGLGWIGEPVFTEILQPVFNWMQIESKELRHVLSFAIGFSAITFLHISAGEQAPKMLAIQKPLPASLWIAYPLLWFYRISYPFVVLLNWCSQWLLRQAGIHSIGEGETAHSEEELRLLFAASQKRGKGSALGREIVLNSLDLPRRNIRAVMRPRQEVVVFDTEATIAECLEIAEKTRYSRFPLAESGDLDRTLGVIHIKDLYAMRLKARNGADLLPAARKLIYVPEMANLENVLQLFLERKSHLAIVVDEYGGSMGLVTLENILEELVGQIQDEFDQETPLLVRTSENTWEVSGGLALHALEELAGEPLQAEAVSTVNGWIMERLGGFPKTGDTLQLKHCTMKVEAMEGHRVGKLLVSRRTDEEPA
jgi:CBS domain containing-hemolysin-like protein